jgi:hypothetical protein
MTMDLPSGQDTPSERGACREGTLSGLEPRPLSVDLSNDLYVALTAFRQADELGDGGLTGMLLALDSVVASFDRLPVRGPLSDPLRALSMTLRDWMNGVVPPSLAKQKRHAGGNRHSQYAIELKARCLVLSRILQRRGDTKLDADLAIMRRVRNIAPLVGLEVGGDSRRPGVNVMDSWRRDARKRPQRNSLRSLQERVQRVGELVATLEQAASSTDQLMDMVLEIPPALLPSQLMHLGYAEFVITDRDRLLEYYKDDPRICAALLACAQRDYEESGIVPLGTRLVESPPTREANSGGLPLK